MKKRYWKTTCGGEKFYGTVRDGREVYDVALRFEKNGIVGICLRYGNENGEYLSGQEAFGLAALRVRLAATTIGNSALYNRVLALLPTEERALDVYYRVRPLLPNAVVELGDSLIGDDIGENVKLDIVKRVYLFDSLARFLRDYDFRTSAVRR